MNKGAVRPASATLLAPVQSMLKYVADPNVKLRLVEFRLLGSLDPLADTTC